jgi:hypothetical protein
MLIKIKKNKWQMTLSHILCSENQNSILEMFYIQKTIFHTNHIKVTKFNF